MDVHPTKNGISRYWSIAIYTWGIFDYPWKTAIFHGYVKWQRGYINRWRVVGHLGVSPMPACHHRYCWRYPLFLDPENFARNPRCCHFPPPPPPNQKIIFPNTNLEAGQIAWKIKWSYHLAKSESPRLLLGSFQLTFQRFIPGPKWFWFPNPHEFGSHRDAMTHT